MMLALLVLILASSSLQFQGGTVGAQECNVVVMTEDQLKREVKTQVIAAFADSEILSPLLDRISHLFFPGKTPSHPATSCMEIKELMPSSPSGYYWIKASDDSTSHMYCDMERRCKGEGVMTGQW